MSHEMWNLITCSHSSLAFPAWSLLLKISAHVKQGRINSLFSRHRNPWRLFLLADFACVQQTETNPHINCLSKFWINITALAASPPSSSKLPGRQVGHGESLPPSCQVDVDIPYPGTFWYDSIAMYSYANGSEGAFLLPPAQPVAQEGNCSLKDTSCRPRSQKTSLGKLHCDKDCTQEKQRLPKCIKMWSQGSSIAEARKQVLILVLLCINILSLRETFFSAFHDTC